MEDWICKMENRELAKLRLCFTPCPVLSSPVLLVLDGLFEFFFCRIDYLYLYLNLSIILHYYL